ncbi:retrotransposon protein, putative, ty1-copia subclass [Tanacetum coccineum]
MYVIEQPIPPTPAADSVANDLSVGLILNGLTSDFAGFAVTPQVIAIQGGRIQKANKKSQNAKGKGKGKGKGKDKSYVPKPKNPKPNAKEHPAKNDACHHYKEVGHWKRNCPVYLAELMKNKKQAGFASSSGIFTIELFSFPNKSWVYDTGCGTHICITKQGLSEARKLKQGDIYLYVGNGVRTQVEAIGSYDLVLPNGLVICLYNFHYAPSITRSVVSVSRLVENGFVQCFTDYGISVSRNNVLYFNAIPSNGIYEIDMSNSHCRLAHIRKKCIEKLQHDGLLKSTDDESFDQYVSCLSGKMTRKSFPHRPERATDLLSIIHTNLTPPYTPQHNGVSKRKNHTLLEIVRSMMNLTTLPLSFWDYALESAARILNMVQTKKVDKTPYELWFGKVPNLSYLNVWGYPKETMGYYFYFPSENKIVVARYAEFFEKNILSQEVSVTAGELKEIQDEDTSPYEITSEIPMEVEEVEEHSLGDLNEPANYKAAMLDQESNKWLDAMNAEMQSVGNYI